MLEKQVQSEVVQTSFLRGKEKSQKVKHAILKCQLEFWEKKGLDPAVEANKGEESLFA